MEGKGTEEAVIGKYESGDGVNVNVCFLTDLALGGDT